MNMTPPPTVIPFLLTLFSFSTDPRELPLSSFLSVLSFGLTGQPESRECSFVSFWKDDSLNYRTITLVYSTSSSSIGSTFGWMAQVLSSVPGLLKLAYFATWRHRATWNGKLHMTDILWGRRRTISFPSRDYVDDVSHLWVETYDCCSLHHRKCTSSLEGEANHLVSPISWLILFYHVEMPWCTEADQSTSETVIMFIQWFIFNPLSLLFQTVSLLHPLSKDLRRR